MNHISPQPAPKIQRLLKSSDVILVLAQVSPSIVQTDGADPAKSVLIALERLAKSVSDLDRPNSLAGEVLTAGHVGEGRRVVRPVPLHDTIPPNVGTLPCINRCPERHSSSAMST